MALVFQNRISEVDKTTKLKYTEVMESIGKSKNNLKGLKFGIDSKFKDNIMILDESDFENLYGINLVQIPNYLKTVALSVK